MGESLESRLDALYDAAMAASEGARDASVAELLNPYLRHRPQHGRAWHWYGVSLGNLGLWVEAEHALQRAIELADSPFWPRWRLAHVYRRMGAHEAAEREYERATALPEGADLGWIWITRGANLARMNRLDEALACHRRSLTMDNADHDEAHMNIGLILRAKGHYAESADAFRHALEITPDYPEAMDGLASLDGIAEAVRLANSIQE